MTLNHLSDASLTLTSIFYILFTGSDQHFQQKLLICVQTVRGAALQRIHFVKFLLSEYLQ